MNDSLLINKVLPHTEDIVNNQDEVSDFITTNKHWVLADLEDTLPASIIEKFQLFLVPINNLEDNLI